MADTNTIATLDGLFKIKYADKLEDLKSDCAILQKEIRFRQSEKIGEEYIQPTLLTRSHGVTYATSDAGAFALNAPVVLNTKKARVKGNQFLLRERLAYDSMYRSTPKGEISFDPAVTLVVASMAESISHRLEASMLYGESGIGTSTTDNTAVDATHTQLTVDLATWAVGMWTGSENAIVNVYNGASYSSATLVSSGADSDFVVTGVDTDNRVLTLEGTATGITALETAANGTNVLHFAFKSSKGNEMAGINKIITNARVLFGIDAAAYSLWKASTFAVGGVSLTIGALDKAISRAVGKGGLVSETTTYVAPITWSNVNNDLGARRMFDSSYRSSDGTIGHEAITYFSQNGRNRLVSHPMVKQGEAFVLPTKYIKRIGSTDVTFRNPGSPVGGENRFFRELSDNAGCELRCYADQAIFITHPAKMIKLTGIVNA